MSMNWSELTHWFSITGNTNTLIVIFTGLVAVFTFFQVFVGWRQWQQLKNTVNLARQEFISTHRPRMRIRHVRVHKPLRAGEPVLIDVVGVNTGDTEARITSFRVTTHVGQNLAIHPPNHL